MIAVLAVVFSVTAFAATDCELTDYNLIIVIQKNLEMTLSAIFKTADAIYIFFSNLFG